MGVLFILESCLKLLHRIPHELGHIPRLSVLNISDNFIQYLPFSITRLSRLSAIWISENQNKPLVPFQSTVDPETGQRVLTCILLPQIPREGSDDGNSELGQSASWENRQQPIIKFAGDGHIVDQPSALVRLPTPYPKEMKAHAKHAKNLALKHYTKSSTPNGSNLSETNLVCPDVTACAVDSLCVKEAKTSKPKSPILSTLPKPSTPTFQESSQESQALMNTTQSADSGMASGLCSDIHLSSVQSSNQKLAEYSVQDANKNQIFGKASNLEYNSKSDPANLPVASSHKIVWNRNVADVADRGYRSDNEFYAENDRNLTSTPEGYHSDWEAVSGKFTHCSPNVGHHLHSKSYIWPSQRNNESGSSVHRSIKHFSPQKISENSSLLANPQGMRNLPWYEDYPQNQAGINLHHQYHLNKDRFSPVAVTSPSTRYSASPTQMSVPLHQLKQCFDSAVSQQSSQGPGHNPTLPPHPRQPPDYDTALQRSSLYSKYHGPIDANLGEASQVYSSQSSPRSQIFRIESQPSSRLSHVSDTGSTLSSSTNNFASMNRMFSSSGSPTCNNQISETFLQQSDVPDKSSPVDDINALDKNHYETAKTRKIPPPLPPKPNLAYLPPKSSLTQKQLDESVYKELRDINCYALEKEKGLGEDIQSETETHTAVPVHVISDVKTNDNDVRSLPNNGNKPTTYLGFTPISPAPNSQTYNHIVRPSVPPQQWPVISPTGQWVFGTHKNPKVCRKILGIWGMPSGFVEQTVAMFPVIIEQNPDIGFTICEMISSNGSAPLGIFVELVASDGPASSALRPGDKILEVDGIDFSQLDSEKAISVLNSCKSTLCLMSFFTSRPVHLPYSPVCSCLCRLYATSQKFNIN
ncbi:Erbin [Nymphon striatum]|nr:Erbin [Nymphon striatum]